MDRRQLEQKSEPELNLMTNIRLKIFGPRVDGASTTIGYYYFALAGIALAIIAQYNSMQCAKYANQYYKPSYIFIDSAGSAFLVETPNKDQPIISEIAIRSSLWRVVRAQYEVVGDTAAQQTDSLINYYLDGQALGYFQQNSNNPNILGTSAEKAKLITDGQHRHIELRSMRFKKVSPPVDGSQKIAAELMFYARTYAYDSTEPILRRAFRVDYEFTIASPLESGLDLSEQRRFLTENPLLLRIQSFNIRSENAEVPLVPENQNPQSSYQSRALAPTGATPVVAASKTGGPVATHKNSLAH